MPAWPGRRSATRTSLTCSSAPCAPTADSNPEVSQMISLREYREPTSRLPDYLPWACLIAPGVVLQKDALLQKTVSFRGPDLASSSNSELMSSVARLNNALK